MPCPVCRHPQRREIDQALLAGSATLAALSQAYGLSTAALHRHQGHLQAKVNQAQAPLQNNLRQGCLFWLTQALHLTMQTAQAAQAENNFKLVLQAILQGTRIAGIILKQDCQLAPEVVYEILAAPQSASPDGLLPYDPQILAASRQALAGTLDSPCPDHTDPPPVPAPREDLELCQENLLGLARSAVQPKTGKQKPATDRRQFQPRPNGGKSPGKNLFLKNNNEKDQGDKLLAKIAGNLDLMQPSRFAAGGTWDSKLKRLLSEKIPADIPLSEYIYEQSLKESPPV